MAGVEDRLKIFLDSWPILEKHLNELLEEVTRDVKRREVEGGDRLPWGQD
jgi:hypothetical protein